MNQLGLAGGQDPISCYNYKGIFNMKYNTGLLDDWPIQIKFKRINTRGLVNFVSNSCTEISKLKDIKL